MNNKVKFKGPMKHFMRWPLYLSVLVVLLDLLVFIVSVKAGILVSAGTVIYIFIAVQLFRYHKPLIVNDMIAFANPRPPDRRGDAHLHPRGKGRYAHPHRQARGARAHQL